MKSQKITIARTTMHEKSDEFWDQGYEIVEPWFNLNDLLYNQNIATLIKDNKKFVYPVYTTGHPDNWLVSRKGLLNCFDISVLQYASKGKVLIYINQICEGFSLISKDLDDTYWARERFDYYEILHSWLHKNSIPFQNVIYHTSNLLEEENYNSYCFEHNIQEKIKIISEPAFADLVKSDNYFLDDLDKIKLNFKEQFEYKIKNNIQLFSCLNRRDRPHRGALLLFLNYYNLINDNQISFPPFSQTEHDNNLLVSHWNANLHAAFNQKNVDILSKKLPLILDSDKFEINWADTFLKETYLKTWISLITETLYHDEVDSVFVSEKVFKPMLALHPFIVVGHVNTLKELKKIGFKTFDKWWDESYDTETNPINRFEKICNVLMDLKKLSKKDFSKIYLEMYDVLIHNQKHLLTKNFTRSEVNKNYVKEFFTCM